jgi:hypothetical protein
MKPILVASAAMWLLSGSVLADSITSPTGSFSAFPSGFSSTTPNWQGQFTQPTTASSPFWNNPSDDTGTGGSHMMNIGYVLSDSGGLQGTPSVLGSDSVTQEFTADGTDPAAFNFVSSGTPFDITLLFADSSLDTGNAAQGTVFGYYVGNTFTPVYTVGDTFAPTDTELEDPATLGNSYGFYVTVCYGGGFCETYTTGNGNTGNESGAAGWNHFALFQLASGNYAMGFTAADADVGEGLGDFNDVVVELQAIPEPGTIGALALGLAGLALFARCGARLQARRVDSRVDV